jgi:hypothetical protein
MSLLQTIFRGRRAPRGARTFQPTVSSLENRQLLSISLVGSPEVLNITKSQTAMKADKIQITSSPVYPQATTDWGDGTGTQSVYLAAVYGQPGKYWVGGGHNYQKPGTYSVQVTVKNLYRPGDQAAWTDTVNVFSYLPTAEIDPETLAGPPDSVVGAQWSALALLRVPGDPAASITNVTWMITDPDGVSPGAIKEQKIGPDGFVNTTVLTTNTRGPGPISTLSGLYWDATPGKHNLQAYISWADQDGIQPSFWAKSIEWDVTRPTTVMTPTMNNDAGAINLLLVDQDLEYYQMRTDGPDGTTPALDLKATIDPNQPGAAGGIFGVVQTMQRTLYKWVVTDDEGDTEKRQFFVMNDDGVWKNAKTLLDNTPPEELPDGGFTPYYGSHDTPPKLTWNTGETLEIKDSPNATIHGSLGESAMTDSTTFTDTIMFTPSGGIAVPIASMEWGYRASATVDITFDGTTTALFWVSDPDVKTDPAPTSTFPTWGDFVPNYKKDVDGVVVAWTPPPVDPDS